MNIFVLDPNPERAVRHYCRPHVNKMLLETAQLMCSVYRHYGLIAPYRATHMNHPCSVWARETFINFLWLGDLGIQLSERFRKEFGHDHKSAVVIRWCLNHAGDLPLSEDHTYELTEWPQAMPEEFKRPGEPVKAYRDYYASKLRDFRHRGLI